jgi:serine/threonine protein kinase
MVGTTSLLVDDWAAAKIKVCDFGLSSMRAATESATVTINVLSSPSYSAPELSSGEHGYPVDVYSFSIILWELVTGLRVWQEIPRPFMILQAVEQGKRPEVPNNMFAGLIESCWDQDPSSRPQFSRVFEILEGLELSHSAGDASSGDASPGPPAFGRSSSASSGASPTASPGGLRRASRARSMNVKSFGLPRPNLQAIAQGADGSSLSRAASVQSFVRPGYPAGQTSSAPTSPAPRPAETAPTLSEKLSQAELQLQILRNDMARERDPIQRAKLEKTMGELTSDVMGFKEALGIDDFPPSPESDDRGQRPAPNAKVPTGNLIDLKDEYGTVAPPDDGGTVVAPDRQAPEVPILHAMDGFFLESPRPSSQSFVDVLSRIGRMSPERIRSILPLLVNADDTINRAKWVHAMRWFTPLCPEPASGQARPASGFLVSDMVDVLGRGEFHGNLSTTEAGPLLLSRPAGSYLIRFSTTVGAFSLSASSGTNVFHWRFNPGSGTTELRLEHHTYANVADVIQKHSPGGLALRCGMSTATLYLESPVNR